MKETINKLRISMFKAESIALTWAIRQQGWTAFLGAGISGAVYYRILLVEFLVNQKAKFCKEKLPRLVPGNGHYPLSEPRPTALRSSSSGIRQAE